MKIDILKSVNELMGLGLTWEAASSAVRYFDGMSADERAKDSERKRKYRAAKKTGATNPRSNNKTSISSTEVKEQPIEVVIKKVSKRKPEIPLPKDFAPTEAHFARAALLGCPREFVLKKFEHLKLWAEENDARKRNWSGTLHGFIRRDAEKGLHLEQPNYGQTVRAAVTQLKSGNIAAINPAGSGPGARPALRLVSAGEGDQS